MRFTPPSTREPGSIGPLAESSFDDSGFRGTDRYVSLTPLGEGGMGAVYHVYDRQRGEEVALKTLLRTDPQSLFRLKQEFRGLSDVVHRNLVVLHELDRWGDRWFFTMELVRGVGLTRWVWPEGPHPLDQTLTDAFDATHWSAFSPTRAPAVSTPGWAPDVDRIRCALGELADAVRFLHAAGKLHRDLKPSNVMVTDQGRVVLLDFGLVMDELARANAWTGARIVGTAGYMAPEQARGTGRITGAADWYSFGAVLYQCLTGATPPTGAPASSGTGPDPRDIYAESPPDLAELCSELLSPSPHRRPVGPDIVRRLGRCPSTSTWFPVRALTRLSPLIGRRSELQQLGHAWDRVRSGGPVLVRVHGGSGIGKTALVHNFLTRFDSDRSAHPALILEGRCHELDGMPYRAVDAIVDQLAQHLRQLPLGEVSALVPPDAAQLAEVFPALSQIAVGTADRRAETGPQRRARKARMRSVLRELLRRVAAHTPLVLFIDDLQWADPDSAALLSALLEPPHAPAMMLIVAYRTDDVSRSPALRQLLWTQSPPGRGRVELELGPMELDTARELAAHLLAETPRSGVSEHVRDEIVRESRGSPFFLTELARRANELSAADGVSSTIRELVLHRASVLSADARLLLCVVAVAGAPVREALATAAADTGDISREVIARLRAAHLLRRHGGPDGPLDVYHPRVRESVLDSIPVDQKARLKAALARALESQARGDPDRLARHYLIAGDSARAAGDAITPTGSPLPPR